MNNQNEIIEEIESIIEHLETAIKNDNCSACADARWIANRNCKHAVFINRWLDTQWNGLYSIHSFFSKNYPSMFERMSAKDLTRAECDVLKLAIKELKDEQDNQIRRE